MSFSVLIRKFFSSGCEQSIQLKRFLATRLLVPRPSTLPKLCHQLVPGPSTPLPLPRGKNSSLSSRAYLVHLVEQVVVPDVSIRIATPRSTRRTVLAPTPALAEIPTTSSTGVIISSTIARVLVTPGEQEVLSKISYVLLPYCSASSTCTTCMSSTHWCRTPNICCFKTLPRPTGVIPSLQNQKNRESRRITPRLPACLPPPRA